MAGWSTQAIPTRLVGVIKEFLRKEIIESRRIEKNQADYNKPYRQGKHNSSYIWVFPKIVGFPPKSSIFIGFSIVNHPFWGTPIFGNTHMLVLYWKGFSTINEKKHAMDYVINM